MLRKPIKLICSEYKLQFYKGFEIIRTANGTITQVDDVLLKTQVIFRDTWQPIQLYGINEIDPLVKDDRCLYHGLLANVLEVKKSNITIESNKTIYHVKKDEVYKIYLTTEDIIHAYVVSFDPKSGRDVEVGEWFNHASGRFFKCYEKDWKTLKGKNIYEADFDVNNCKKLNPALKDKEIQNLLMHDSGYCNMQMDLKDPLSEDWSEQAPMQLDGKYVLRY